MNGPHAQNNNLTIIKRDNLTQGYDWNNGSKNQCNITGPAVPGFLPQISGAEPPEFPVKQDVACPPFCDNANMTNEEFFIELAKKELWEPSPWKKPRFPRNLYEAIKQ